MLARYRHWQGVFLIVVATGLYSEPASAKTSNSNIVNVSNSLLSPQRTASAQRFKNPVSSDGSSRALQVSGQKWLIAGIAATLSGAMIGSMALAVGLVDACAPWAGNSCIKDAQSRAVWAMGVPSAILLGSGVGMIGYGGYLKHKARLSIQAHASSANLAVSVSGRF